VNNVYPWLLAFTLGVVTLYSVTSKTTEPQPHKIPLDQLHEDQLQLIPSIGPVLAGELKNLQGHDLKACRGIGTFREQTLRHYLTTQQIIQP
jgi:predicted flap endonuclease-1-like 5' DNA nuclease